jgi:hypothetical protein
MMSDFHDCPKCGRKESAWGDGFCGSCEEEYQKHMEEQRFWDEHHDPYNQTWGMMVFLRAEAGEEGVQEYLDRPISEPKQGYPSAAVQEEYLSGLIKARQEARQQLLGEWQPPKSCMSHVPCV